MAFIEQGRRMAAMGLPFPGNGFTDQDRFGVLGIMLPNTALQSSIGNRFTFFGVNTSFGLHRPDAVIRFNDRLGIAGAFAAKEEAGVDIDRFDTIYFIVPTMDIIALPQSVVSSIAIPVAPVTAAMNAKFVPKVVVTKKTRRSVARRLYNRRR